MESRLGSRVAASSGEEGGRGASGRASPETASSAGLPNSAPKRMRLVAPSGVVVSQVSSVGRGRGGEKWSSGGALARKVRFRAGWVSE